MLAVLAKLASAEARVQIHIPGTFLILLAFASPRGAAEVHLKMREKVDVFSGDESLQCSDSPKKRPVHNGFSTCASIKCELEASRMSASHLGCLLYLSCSVHSNLCEIRRSFQGILVSSALGHYDISVSQAIKKRVSPPGVSVTFCRPQMVSPT